MRQFVAQNPDLQELMTFKCISQRGFLLVDARTNCQSGVLKQSISLDKMPQFKNKTLILMDESGQSYASLVQDLNNLSYICTLTGGYKAIHDLVLQLKLKVLEKHLPQSCPLC